MNQKEFPILSAMQAPRFADEKTVRLCDSESDAIATALLLSRVSQAEIARRMGISAPYLTLLKKGERAMTSKLLARFSIATGSMVVQQYRDMQAGIRIATGQVRASDRIAHIASYTLRSAA